MFLTTIYIYSNLTQLRADHGTNLEEIGVKEAVYEQALRELNLPPLEAIPHRYCFQTGPNGESFYLKLGASCEFKWLLERE